MIAPPQRLPFVVWKNNRLVPLSESWLTESITVSAQQAGYASWELAPHIGKAIAVYLEEEFNRNMITIPQIHEMLAQSIEKVGFRDVAEKSQLLSPHVSISLFDIARRASLELLFFPQLQEKLEDAAGYEARGMIFEGLRPCVKALHHARRWRQTCDDLQDRIVDYIRAFVAQHRLENLNLVIS